MSETWISVLLELAFKALTILLRYTFFRSRLNATFNLRKNSIKKDLALSLLNAIPVSAIRQHKRISMQVYGKSNCQKCICIIQRTIQSCTHIGNRIGKFYSIRFSINQQNIEQSFHSSQFLPFLSSFISLLLFIYFCILLEAST